MFLLVHVHCLAYLSYILLVFYGSSDAGFINPIVDLELEQEDIYIYIYIYRREVKFVINFHRTQLS